MENPSGKKRKISGLKMSFMIFLAVYVAAVAGIFLSSYFPKEPGIVSDNNSFGIKPKQKSKVLGEESAIGENSQMMASENYSIGQITLGGNVGMEMILSAEEGQLKISEVSNELVTDKDKKQTKMILNWRTNKPAISEVSYSKDGGNSNQIVKEKEYTIRHTAVIPSLTPATVYTYGIECSDTGGGRVASDKFIIYTGSPNVSLLDVLQNAAQKAFGWAVGK